MREYCTHCKYPKTTCVCSAITRIENRINIIILQHPKEFGHAKNTVRLLELCLTNICVYQGLTSDDFAEVKKALNSTNTALIYPSDNSTTISDLSVNINTSFDNVILIDGSWRQAYAIWCANEWLHTLPTVKFNTAEIESQYTIRHTPFTHSMSTLEATAQVLFQLENIPTHLLQNAQRQLVAHWQSYTH